MDLFRVPLYTGGDFCDLPPIGAESTSGNEHTMSMSSTETAVRILAVVMLYHTTPADSKEALRRSLIS